ncbi:MAG: DUF3737 family protein [Eubacteriales bacterium]|nr:DUF3737 family protein [Eubacteriales bacterium]MDD3883130.1 DUF3737 family protein [Eubacteriales bacterium]MDD4512700.1 DUF3737 family protein [Eubacteriales bacterium]
MKLIQNKQFEEERALYESREVHLLNCRFDGAADGESALKESKHIIAENCFCNLRYPFWHDDDLKIINTEMTGLCRAAIWYSSDISISGTKMHGIKALRECGNVSLTDCDIDSPEFGWSVIGLEMKNSSAKSEYFCMRSENLRFTGVRLSGKYSFQYVKNAVFDSCEFDTKDAFWHAQNVTVRNSVIRGEYLAWYSDSLTLENCKIYGTQPLCYCKNLKIVNCEMHDADLAFEKSDVNAEIVTPMISIKNPRSGEITLPELKQLIMDDENAKGKVTVAPRG